MPTSTIVALDLDGTLIDTTARHFAVYRLTAKEAKIQPVPFDSYWQSRRQGLSNLQVLFQSGLREETANLVKVMWLEQIEESEMLKLDRPFPGVIDWLRASQDIVQFVLVTLRSNSQALKQQLLRLNLSPYFHHILIVPHGVDTAASKAKAVLENVQGQVLAWVGDTEVDMKAAREIGTRALGVTSGMRTQEALIAAGADEIYSRVTEIRNWQ